MSNVAIVSVESFMSTSGQLDRVFEPYRLQRVRRFQYAQVGDARVLRRDRLGGVVHEYVLAA
jgi:hypothetical protein